MKDFQVFTDEEVNKQIDRFEELEHTINELENKIIEKDLELKSLRQLRKYVRWIALSFLITLLSFALS